jgi:hypothetical protein
MQAEELYRLVKQQPFQPFRMYLKDGTTCDVLYPRVTAVSRRTMLVGTPTPEDPDVFETMERIGTDFIERVEMLPTATEAGHGTG